MTGYRRIAGLISGLCATFVLAGAGGVAAQENLDMGKSGAQLFASDCAICHKSPRGLSKTGGIFGVESFLREHYTASRQSAAVLAAYLRGIDDARPAQPERRRAVRTRKPEPKAAGDKPPADAKPAEKPAEKPAAKPADKPADNKPATDKGTQANASAPAAKPDLKPEAAKPEAQPAPASDKKPD